MKTIVQIQVDSLTFPNEEKPALQEIYFDISQGDFIVITGGVASGKSILLHTITGAIPHYHQAQLTGKITIMDQDIAHIPLNKMSDYVGYMMQEPQNQLISLKVWDDVAFGLENLELPLEEIKNRIKSILSFVGLKDFENRMTTSLSGGEAQRVVLAGVLALEAPILILDQPTAELDPLGRAKLYKLLGHLNKTQNLTVILVMDCMEEVLSYANRVLTMENGRIIREENPQEYLKNRKAYIMQKLKNKSKRIPNNQKELILKLTDVTFHYKNSSTGCESINLEIYKGDFLSVVGLNGSGKSTLAKIIIGLLNPSHGEIRIFNQVLTKENLKNIRERCGFLFQNPDYQIFGSSLEEEVSFSLKLRGETKEAIDKKVEESLDFVGLLEYKDMHPQRLSRGQRQLLALSSILISNPEFIIADEPTSGLDENQGYMIMEKLYEFAKNGGTVLLITHDFTMASNFSNRIVAMNKSHIYKDISISELPGHLKEMKEIGLNFTNTLTWKET
ncbi:ABC transporter ATP-binding protein [Alkalibaculum bacchi]|uniref:ABC transporter ATP-binding protein n=1 Tax=Alkalibaculum bacchi TaxID=645887 RepID=UPI0026EBCA41|nr:ABC transporter ATP-binding protein [Alkalibaculum bacchi]